MKLLSELNEKLKDIILKRYSSKEELQKELEEFLGFKIVLEEVAPMLDNRLISNLVSDYENGDIYVDIYYLVDREGSLVITEFTLDSEHSIPESQYQKINLVCDLEYADEGVYEGDE